VASCYRLDVLKLRAAMRLTGHRITGDILQDKFTDYTLVIPAHNRTQLLDRLLGFLERSKAPFPIMIFDSSGAELLEVNRARADASPLDVTFMAFPPNIHPYDKFYEGAKTIKTAYCSMIADDDLVLLPALAKCLNALKATPDSIAAHGIYFNFIEDKNYFNISYTVQRHAALQQPTPFKRVLWLMRHYDVMMYAVFRTPVFVAKWKGCDRLKTTLLAEIWSGLSAAAAGNILRLDDFYLGRSTGESLSPAMWHPHQIFCQSPQALFQDFPAFRQLLIDRVKECGEETPEDVLTIGFDLYGLDYLRPFVRPDVIDLIVEDRMAGMNARATAEHLWQRFVKSTRAVHPVETLFGASGRDFAPDHLMGRHSPRDFLQQTRIHDGTTRTYKLYYEFIFPELKPPHAYTRETLVNLLTQLSSY